MTTETLLEPPATDADLATFYLVVLSHALDDYPLRAFDSRHDAEQFANSCEWNPPASMLESLDLPDANTPVCVAVWVFEKGVPVSRDIVRSHESVV